MRQPNILIGMHCQDQESALTDAEVLEYIGEVVGWVKSEGKITKVFRFHNYYETLAFINAIAYVIHAENHHPRKHPAITS